MERDRYTINQNLPKQSETTTSGRVFASAVMLCVVVALVMLTVKLGMVLFG